MSNIIIPQAPVYAQPDNLNMLQDNHFELSIARLPNTKYFCQKVKLPQLSTEVIKQATPFNAINRQGATIQMTDLEVTFQVHENMDNYIEIVQWIFDGTISRTFNPNYTNNHQNEGKVYSDGTIHILTSRYSSNMKVVFQDLFPTYLSGLTLSTGEGAPTYLSATARFSYKYFDFVRSDT